MKLSALKRKFPIYSDNYKIDIVKRKHVNKYIDEIYKPYFSEFMRNKSVLEQNKSILKLKLISLICTYSTNSEFLYEIRLLIHSKEISAKESFYGGITIFPDMDNSGYLEIAYWVKPKYQGNGIGTESIKRITSFIFETMDNVKGIKVEIMRNNTRSIELIKNCGYKLHEITANSDFIYIKHRT